MNTVGSPLSDLAGTWYLAAERRIEAEADLERPDYRNDGNGEWIQTSGIGMVSSATEVQGLTLTITEDGVFTESGESSATIFDAQGVETIGEGFDGHLEPVGTRLLAFTGDRFYEPVPSIADPSPLRLSDGSTDIAELFELLDGRLVRTQNVVTDGIYLVRSVLVYDRTAPPAQPSQDVSPPSTSAQDQTLRDAEAALVAALVDDAKGTWKEIVAYANADGSQLMTITFSVTSDESGQHHLVQDFDSYPPLDVLWKHHRAAATNDKGKKWGTAVLVISPPATAAWQIDYRVSRVMRGEHDDTYKRYQKYLPIFLEENRLDR